MKQNANKHCLLDTQRAARVNEENLVSTSGGSELSCKKASVEYVQLIFKLVTCNICKHRSVVTLQTEEQEELEQEICMGLYGTQLLNQFVKYHT